MKKADADKLVRWAVAEVGALNISVAEEPTEPPSMFTGDLRPKRRDVSRETSKGAE